MKLRQTIIALLLSLPLLSLPSVSFAVLSCCDPFQRAANCPPAPVRICPDSQERPQCWQRNQDCGGTVGMARWFVSEPLMNVHLEDRPLGYQPSRGFPMNIDISYQQRGGFPFDENVSNLGPDWSFSLRSFLLVYTNYGTGEVNIYQHEGGVGWIGYYGIGGTDGWTGNSVATTNGRRWVIFKPDGAQDIYETPFTNSLGKEMFFLSKKQDVTGAGLALNYSYGAHGTNMLLSSIVDADELTNSFHYSTDTNHPGRLTGVVDPYGRECQFFYDADGKLATVYDAENIPSSFYYGEYGITNLTTPYGPTWFEYAGLGVDNIAYVFYAADAVNRAVRVTQPDGGQQLYVYRHDGSAIPLSTTYSSLPSYGGVIDNVNQAEANSFHWSARQCMLLSTNYSLTGDVNALTPTDFALARQRHWLFDDYTGGATVVEVLSNERAPSPDGVTAGAVTWYDYAGKGAANTVAYDAFGFVPEPKFVGPVLPNGETAGTVYTYSPSHHLIFSEQSYTLPDGSVGTRTNYFDYDSVVDFDPPHGLYLKEVDMLVHYGPSGMVRSNHFNSMHQLTNSWDGLNQLTHFDYDALHRLTNRITPTGLRTALAYGYDGYVSDIENYDGGTLLNHESFTWSTGLPRTHTDARNLTTTLYWDGLQRLTGVAFPDGTSLSNRYTVLDLTAHKDRLGNWSYFAYDPMRRLTNAADARGVTNVFVYCTCGALDSVTEASGTAVARTTTYTRDYTGRVLVETPPDCNITNHYDAIGRLDYRTGPGGPQWFGYNNQGLVNAVTNATGLPVLSLIYDIEDRAGIVRDAAGVASTNVFDILGRLESRSWAGGSEGYGYTLNVPGPTSFANALGKTWYYTYDPLGRKTLETNPNSETLQFYYTPAGDLQYLVDGRSQTTTWNYDVYGRVTNKLDQSSAEVFRFAYNPNGWLTNRWTPAKGNTVYKYDAVGNLTNVVYPSGTTSLAYRYDALNRLTNMADAVGTTVFTYNSGGLLAAEDGPWPSDTVSSYYLERARTNLTLLQPTALWTNQFTWDAAKRLQQVVSPAGTYTYAFDLGASTKADSLVRSLALPGGNFITNTYDALARLTGTFLKKGDGTILDSATYTLNAAHQRTGYTNNAGTSVGYRYDDLGQLKVADSSVNSEDRGYAYDASWNLINRTNNGSLQSFTVNNKNQMTSAPDGNDSYDGNGNLVSAESGVALLAYDAENQLVLVTNDWSLAHPKLTKFIYDGMNRLRIRREYEYVADEESLVGGGGGQSQQSFSGEGAGMNGAGGSDPWTLVNEVRYIYDGWRVIQERDSNNVPLVSYTRGTDLSGSLQGAGGIGGLLARSHGYSSGAWTSHNSYHADGNGNITALVDSSGTLQASYRYDPYGNLLAISGSLATANNYRFSSKEWIGTPSLYYYGYRFYSPNWQRWVNQDPIQENGGINLFGFAENEPMTGFDPLGLDNPISFSPGNEYGGWQGRGPAVSVGTVDGRGNPGLFFPVIPSSYDFSRLYVPMPIGSARWNPSKWCWDSTDQISDLTMAIAETALILDGVKGGFDLLSASASRLSCFAAKTPLRVDPAELRLPPTRAEGADPFKLADQIKKYGTSTEGMPPIQVTRGANGEMMINDGVTRATRGAMTPGTTVPVQVIEQNPALNLGNLPKVGERTPGRP